MQRDKSDGHTVLFRADGSAIHGVGHLARCATLARALQARGAQVHLAVRPGEGLPDWVLRLFPGPVHLLPEAKSPPPTESADGNSDWLAVSQEDDAHQVLDVISTQMGDRGCDWIVVDQYGIDASWHRAMSASCGAMMAIDDLADRALDVDLLLDQNRDPAVAAVDYSTHVQPETRILAGPSWSLLREKFGERRRLNRLRGGDPLTVLIVMGGSDPRELTLLAVEALSSRSPAMKIVAVVGDPLQADRLRALGTTIRHDLDVRVAESNMAAVMDQADMAISAAGSTVWELCCMGVPMALIAEELNQAAVVDQAVRAGAALQVAEPRAAEILQVFDTMVHESGRLDSMSNAGQSLVDGNGAGRVCEAMLTA